MTENYIFVPKTSQYICTSSKSENYNTFKIQKENVYYIFNNNLSKQLNIHLHSKKVSNFIVFGRVNLISPLTDAEQTFL